MREVSDNTYIFNLDHRPQRLVELKRLMRHAVRFVPLLAGGREIRTTMRRRILPPGSADTASCRWTDIAFARARGVR